MSPAWPKYTGFAVGDVAIAFRCLADPRHLRPALTVLFLVAVYVAGLFVPIPGLHVVEQRNRWWFLVLLDGLLAGGALGRGCLFGMGLFAPMLLNKRAKSGFVSVLIRHTLGLGVLAILLATTLRVQGMVPPGKAHFAMVAGWLALGGIILKLVSTQLGQYHGPAPFYINLFVLLAVSIRSSFEKLLRAGQPGLIWMIVACLAFITLSALFVLRNRISIDVESIKSAETHQKAKLEIAAVDEPLLDSIGGLCLIIYICIAGCLSLALGWRVPTAGSHAVFLLVSVIVFALVWSTFNLVERLWNRIRPVDEANVFGITDPREYALRMLNNFWIIPGCRAGPDTEAYIQRRLRSAVQRAFWLLSSWVACVLIVEYVLSRANSTVTLFPYGPVVFVFMMLMMTGNLSMLLRQAGASVGRFRQLLRGQSRVLAQTYPLGSPHQASRLTMDAPLQNYWEGELSDQLGELIDWTRLVREMQLLQPKTRRPSSAVLQQTMRLVANVVTGIIVAFVVGTLCVVFFPGISRRDLATVCLPLLVSSFFAPEMILRGIKRIGLR